MPVKEYMKNLQVVAGGFVIISKVTISKVSIIKASVSKVIISKVSIRQVISSKVSISKVIIRKVSISIHVVSLNYQTIRGIATIISKVCINKVSINKVSISKVIISIHKVSLNYQTNCQPGAIFTALHFLHEPNKLEFYITIGWKVLPKINAHIY